MRPRCRPGNSAGESRRRSTTGVLAGSAGRGVIDPALAPSPVVRRTRLRSPHSARARGGSRMRRSRVVQVVLLAVAMLQVGALCVMVGAILGARAPATAAAHPPPSAAPPRVDVAAPSRGAEIVEIPVPGRLSPIRARVVYPERLPAPTVMVVPVAPATPSAGPAPRASRADLSRLSDWVRGIAGAVAAEGFIAVAPDSPASATPG